MSNFFLHLNTKVYFGIGELSKLGAVAKTYKSVLMVIGGGSVEKSGILNKAQNALDQKGIKHFLFKGIEPNPKDTTIDRAADFARENKVEAIIALGGGSVMDASKLISVVAKQGGKCWDYARHDQKPLKIKEALPIITIPTLSATGSETNIGAVISNSKTKEKYAVHSNICLPYASIIDPELTLSVPSKYLVDGGVDIIVHVLETYLSNNTETPIADNLTLAIAKTAKDSLETILKTKNPINKDKTIVEKSLKARESMAWAASLAINGMLHIQNGAWPLHTVEHAMSAMYDISHGAGLSFLIVPFLEFNKKANPKIAKFLGYFLKDNLNFYKDNVDQGIKDFLTWQKDIGTGKSSKVSPKDMDIEKIVKISFKGGHSAMHNARELNESNLKDILKRMKEIW